MSTNEETTERPMGIYEFARYQLSSVAFDLSPTDEGSPERVVSAWKHLPSTDTSDAHGPEGWALFDAVRSDLGEEIALRDFDEEELECRAEYSWFHAFAELADAYGIEDWPKAALTDYLRGFEGMHELEARVMAALMWEKAKHLYNARKADDPDAQVPVMTPEEAAA